MHTFYSYETAAMRSVNPANTPRDNLINAALGLAGECGEVADVIKKHVYQGHELNVPKIAEELGDILWYIAQACKAIDISMNDIATGNVEKLLDRYPSGFDPVHSINRRREEG